MPFKKGQIVNVLNTSMAGEVFLEGKARIVTVLDAKDSLYRVKFPDDICLYRRFVDPRAQGKPEAVRRYIDKLNAQIARA